MDDNNYKTTTLPSGATVVEADNPIKIVPIVPEVVQPTNQEVMDNIMIVMLAINDIYSMLPEQTV